MEVGTLWQGIAGILLGVAACSTKLGHVSRRAWEQMAQIGATVLGNSSEVGLSCVSPHTVDQSPGVQVEVGFARRRDGFRNTLVVA